MSLKFRAFGFYKFFEKRIQSRFFGSSKKSSKIKIPPHLVPGQFPGLKRRNFVPRRIATPSYYLTGLVEKLSEQKGSSEEFYSERNEKMENSGGYAGMIRYIVSDWIKEGVTPEQIDTKIHAECIKHNFYPGSLDYKGFTRSVSISVNEVACHGIPDTRPFHRGDIVKVDFMSFVDGYYGDCCGTFSVGEVGLKRENLIHTAKESLEEAIKKCGPGVPFREIGRTISNVVRKEKFNVIKEFTGHGIGKNLHCSPFVFSFENENDNEVMEENMTFTIEPIITSGEGKVEIWPDKWSVVTIDKEPCAQFEETILITSDGAKVLTRHYLADGKNSYKIKRREL